MANKLNKQHMQSESNKSLVSCIMVTRDRADFVSQSFRYFLQQTYVRKELIIVDDGEQPLCLSPAMKEYVQYLRVPRGLTLGEKRNIACEKSRGDVIMQWDDDDWYGPMRITAQIQPILAGTAEITALTMGLVLELDPMRFWRCSSSVHQRMFVGNVHGGTLTYSRRYIDEGVRYRAISLAEDAYFLFDAKRKGGRLCKLPPEDLFVYVRHGSNAWDFVCGEHIDAAGWSREPMPKSFAADLPFYRNLAESRERVRVS